MASDVYDKGAPLAEAAFYLIRNSFGVFIRLFVKSGGKKIIRYYKGFF
jgi:hypothetical protein